MTAGRLAHPEDPDARSFSTESSGINDLNQNEGILTAVVWPTYAGAVNDRGEEPMGDRDYGRGQISWGLNEQGRLVGRVRINVPAGIWPHIIYTHHPTTPGFITAQKLGIPFVFSGPSDIEMIDITDEDVRPLAPDPVLHD